MTLLKCLIDVQHVSGESVLQDEFIARVKGPMYKVLYGIAVKRAGAVTNATHLCAHLLAIATVVLVLHRISALVTIVRVEILVQIMRATHVLAPGVQRCGKIM